MSGKAYARFEYAQTCRLQAIANCKIVSNDLDETIILHIVPGDINVEIRKPDVEGNGGSGLLTGVGASALAKDA